MRLSIRAFAMIWLVSAPVCVANSADRGPSCAAIEPPSCAAPCDTCVPEAPCPPTYHVHVPRQRVVIPAPCPPQAPVMQPVVPQQVTAFAGTLQAAPAPAATPAIGLSWVRIPFPVPRLFAVPRNHEVRVPVMQSQFAAVGQQYAAPQYAAPVAQMPMAQVPVAQVPVAQVPVAAVPYAAPQQVPQQAPSQSEPAAAPEQACQAAQAAEQRAAELEEKVRRLEAIIAELMRQQTSAVAPAPGANPTMTASRLPAGAAGVPARAVRPAAWLAAPSGGAAPVQRLPRATASRGPAR